MRIKIGLAYFSELEDLSQSLKNCSKRSAERADENEYLWKENDALRDEINELKRAKNEEHRE